MNITFNEMISDEIYLKGFKEGRKLKGKLISIGDDLYLLTGAQYAKFKKMYKNLELGKDPDFSDALQYVQIFGEFIGNCEQYNF